MRKLALAAVALAFTGSAYAADVPLKAVPAIAAPVFPFNWGGWYIGLNAGAGWTRESFATLPQATLVTNPFDSSPQWGTALNGSSTTGFAGGGQVGYNWPSAGPVVIGVEADIESFGGKANHNSTFVTLPLPPPSATVTNSITSKTPWVATLRGRVGTTSILNPTVLFYVTGGLAAGQQDVTGTINTSVGATPIESFLFSISDTRFGWTAGAGHRVGVEQQLVNRSRMAVYQPHVERPDLADQPPRTQCARHRRDVAYAFVRTAEYRPRPGEL
jgi:outer membrane immunogenic protein